MIMKIVYRYYEPNQGLEEIQARLFNQATNGNATAEQIQNRYETEQTDPRFVRYAFTEEGEPLAYCQARIEENQSIAIGYPWAIPDCPTEVQEKLFDELLQYIKRSNPKEIHYWLNVNWKDQIEFFRKKGFIRSISGFAYDFDVNQLSQKRIDQTFSTRIATDDDLNTLLEIAKVDKDLKRVFTEKGFISYFKDKVLYDGHCVLTFKDNLVVSATAPLREWPDKRKDDKFMILRFTATRPSFFKSWKTLLIAVAKECVTAGWTDLSLRVFDSSEAELARILKEYDPKIEPSYDMYVLKE